MQSSKVSIAKKTLILLETQSWNRVSLSKVLGNKRYANINNKNDLLININRYFDYLLKENLISLEKSSTKDMLFEVLMARLDILNIHRKSIKSLLNYFLSKY